MLKFTQEIKDKWLEALKSGKYKQGFAELKTINDKGVFHCCIGVLGEIHPKLELNAETYDYLDNNDISSYDIHSANDDLEYERKCRHNKQARDYSNVIPLIEQLPVKD